MPISGQSRNDMPVQHSHIFPVNQSWWRGGNDRQNGINKTSETGKKCRKRAIMEWGAEHQPKRGGGRTEPHGGERGRAPTCGSHYQTLRLRNSCFPSSLPRPRGGSSSLKTHLKALEWLRGKRRHNWDMWTTQTQRQPCRHCISAWWGTLTQCTIAVGKTGEEHLVDVMTIWSMWPLHNMLSPLGSISYWSISYWSISYWSISYRSFLLFLHHAIPLSLAFSFFLKYFPLHSRRGPLPVRSF